MSARVRNFFLNLGLLIGSFDQKFSNFVCRTKIGGLIDKIPDFVFDSFLTTAVFTQNKTVAKTLWSKILNFCPKIMIHFCHLNQWNSDSNSFKSYPNLRFYNLQPLIDFYCYIKVSFLIILDEKKDSLFLDKIWNSGFFFRTLIRVCKQSLEIHEMNKKITFVYQMMINVHTGSY